MPLYKVIFNDGWDGAVEECHDDKAATEWAMELLLDDGGEPGDEAAVYRINEGGRGEQELVGTVEVPGDDD